MDLPAGLGRRAQPGPESLQVVLQILLPTLALHTVEKWLWKRSLGKGTSVSEDTAHTGLPLDTGVETLNASHCSPLYQAATSLKPSAVSALPTLQTQTGSMSIPWRYWFLIQ